MRAPAEAVPELQAETVSLRFLTWPQSLPGVGTFETPMASASSPPPLFVILGYICYRATEIYTCVLGSTLFNPKARLRLPPPRIVGVELRSSRKACASHRRPDVVRPREESMAATAGNRLYYQWLSDGPARGLSFRVSGHLQDTEDQ